MNVLLVVAHDAEALVSPVPSCDCDLSSQPSPRVTDSESGRNGCHRLGLSFALAGDPIIGQVHHFVRFHPGKSEYAEKRFSTEARRLYGVLDKRLEGRELVGDEYSIADIAIWPWISRYEWQQMDLGAFPNVRDWYVRVAERPAVQRGYHVPAKVQEIPMP